MAVQPFAASVVGDATKVGLGDAGRCDCVLSGVAQGFCRALSPQHLPAWVTRRCRPPTGVGSAPTAMSAAQQLAQPWAPASQHPTPGRNSVPVGCVPPWVAACLAQAVRSQARCCSTAALQPMLHLMLAAWRAWQEGSACPACLRPRRCPLGPVRTTSSAAATDGSYATPAAPPSTAPARTAWTSAQRLASVA